MLDKQDLLQIKEVVREVVQTELDAAKKELRGEMHALEERLHGEIVAVKEELYGEIVAVRKELYEKIVDVKSDQVVILDEVERTRNILENRIIRLDNRMGELESCYRSDRLEHDAMKMQCGELEKRVGRLERKMA